MAKIPYARSVAIGPRLRFARTSAGLTQKELSDRAGIINRNYSKYETGETYPPPDVMVRLCQVLDVSSDFLLGLSDEYRAKDSDGGDYICMMGSDGSRHMYRIPDDLRARVSALLKAGVPEIMDEG